MFCIASKHILLKLYVRKLISWLNIIVMHFLVRFKHCYFISQNNFPFFPKVPPISGLPPYDVIKTMAPFASYIPSDYKTMTLATLAAVSNQTAIDTNIKNQYFGDLATNRFDYLCHQPA